MKKRLFNPLTRGLLASFMLAGGIASGTVYTAAFSGNWGTPATWAPGPVPTYTITGTDEVIINAGVNVAMDQNVTFNGSGTQLDILATGTLSAAPHIKLTDIAGTIMGAGSINASQVILGSAAAFTFTGTVVADTISNSIAGLTTTAQMTFYNELNLSGLLTLSTAGVLTAGANSNITMAGGSLAVSAGTLALTAAYSVTYTAASVVAGLELSGTGLGVVTIKVPTTDTVTLSSSLVMTDSLKFTSGILKLNGFGLTTSGQVTGAVSIAGSAFSSITINTATGLSNGISFISGFQKLNNLTVNVGTGNSASITSNLTVNGILTVTGNSILNISGAAVNVVGNLVGTGTIMVNSLTKLAFTGIASVTGNLLLSGINIGKFTENIGNANSVTLGADLNVDTLNLLSGKLVLNGKNLSINGDIAPFATGLVVSSSASTINVTTLAGVTDSIMFPALGDTVKNLNINIGSGGSIKLGSDLVIAGNLNFVKGLVDAQNSNLLMDTKSTITGASTTGYVITTGGGHLTMYDTIGRTTTYQVGTAAHYLPATLNLNVGSSVGTVGVGTLPVVYNHGTSGVVISAFQPMVDGTWLFQNNIGAGINANMSLSWTVTAVVNGFLNSQFDYISHYASVWDNIGDSMIPTVSGSLFTVTRANVTSMSPFAVFNQNTAPSGVNEVAYVKGGIAIYPNPTNENLYVKNTTGNTGVVYGEIYNTLGQQVSSFQLRNDETIVPVYGLTRGMYIIRFHNDNMNIVQKFSKI